MNSTRAQTINSTTFVVNDSQNLKTFIKNHLTRRQGYKPTRSMRLVLHLLAHLQVGDLDVTLPNGHVLRFGEADSIPQARVHFHNDNAARRFLTGGALGFCESYLDGDWSSPDIASFFELILRNTDVVRRKMLGKKWMRIVSRAVHRLRPNSKKGSQKNIYHHYDIGNDFYESWLDHSMTYSSALYKSGDEDLRTAQDQKYQEMIDRLELKPEHHVLEIGCGWGGFAEYAARKVGCKMTCITVSQAQHDYATKRIEKAGLSNNVEIRLQDYRDVRGKFDRIASIEMFEAVGEAYWPVFFKTLRRRLKFGGRAVLQIITIRDKNFETYRKSADYIQRYIFPGGMLPSLSALTEQIEAAGLMQGNHLSFGRDYAKTLAIWNQKFQEAWPKLTEEKGFDTRFKRLWEQYLCYCEAGFNVGSIDVIQIGIDKPKKA